MWAYTTSDLTSAGWTQVTSLTDVSSKYYILVDAGTTYTKGMAVAHAANTSGSLYYQTLADPLTDVRQVWKIAESSGTYTLQALNDDCYVSANNNGWNRTVEASPTNGTFNFTLTDGVWHIVNATGSYDPGNAFGPWEGTKESATDYRVAINKSDNTATENGDNAPGFVIYAIARNSFPSIVTSNYITNSDFSSATGWTEYRNGNNDIGSGKIGTLKVRSEFNAATIDNAHTADQYCFGFEARWNGSYSSYNQTTSEMPSGNYTLIYDVQNVNANTETHTNYANYFKTTVGGVEYSDAAKEWMTKGNTSWTTHSVGFTLTTASTANISLGCGSGPNNIELAKTPCLYVSNMILTYTNYTVALSKAIAYATHVNTSIDNSTLAAAISNAQNVLDNKDNTPAYQTTINNAITTLNSAVSTALEAEMSSGDDVTYLLLNPSFEDGQTWYIKTNGGDSYYANNWENSSAFASDSWSYSVLSDEYKSAGSKSYKIRFNWGNATYNVSQTIPVTLPSGRYTITADVRATNDNGSTNYAYAKGNTTQGSTVTVSTSSFSTVTVVADLDAAGSLNVLLGMDYRFDTRSNTNNSAQGIYYWDNVTLTYTSASEAYAAAVAAATTTYNNSSYANVTGTENTALKALIDQDASSFTVAEYFAGVTYIENAVAAFTAAKDNYDEYAEAVDIVSSIGATSVTAPTTADEALTRAHELNVNIDTKVASTYTYDVTSVYGGAWAFTNLSENASGQHWSGDSRKYIDNNVNGDGTATQTITLPAGNYVLKVAGRGSANATSVTMTANGQTVNFKRKGDQGVGIDLTGAANFAVTDATYCNSNKGRGWEWRFLPLTLSEETNVTVTLSIARSTTTWASFSDFTILMSSTDADADDYAALNAAISTAEGHTLGFEVGQYAPYDNITALTKLAAAKGINQEATNAKGVVNAATAALVTANTSSWTANIEDVDAIYNKDFALATDGWNPDGWTSTGWAARVDNINETKTISATGKGWRPNTGTITYGNTGVYTMPLAENQLYKLTFKYGAWDGWSTPTISVLNSADGLAATVLAATNTNYKESMISQTMYFKTGAAGNYVLSMKANYNMVYTDVSLVKATDSDITLSSGTPDLHTYYQTLMLNRSLSDVNWNTFCIPFAMDATAVSATFSDVKTLSSIGVDGENVTLNFSDATTIVAGTPYLVKAKSAGALELSNIKVDGSITDAGTTVTSEVDGYTVTYVGTFNNKSLTSSDTEAWIVKDNKLYNVNSTVNVGPYRGYFVLTEPAVGDVKALNFNIGNETGISVIDNAELTVGNTEIYNLAGQRVGKAQRSAQGDASHLKTGLYIMNGKKVVVK